MLKVSVHIVTWNSRNYIENCLHSLDEQTFKDFSVLIVDNGSNDGTLEWLHENYPQIKIVKNKQNLGFAKGHNQAISFTKSEYVLAMNHDVILKECFLEKIVDFMDAHPEAGSSTGKIYKLTGDPTRLKESSFTKTIDSTGLKIFKSRRVVDRGEGEMDTIPPPYQGGDKGGVEIFGVSGVAPLYRRAALEDASIEILNIRNRKNNSSNPSQPPLGKGRRVEYFDEDFVSYKEDVDLAWRLRLRDWSAYFVPLAVAYHHRGAGGKEAQGNIATLKNRLKKPGFINMMSNRNHLWMLAKNDHISNVLFNFFYILWYEVRKWGIVLLFEQKSLLGLWQYFAKLPKMLKKRKYIQASSKVQASETREWFM